MSTAIPENIALATGPVAIFVARSPPKERPKRKMGVFYWLILYFLIASKIRSHWSL